MRREPGEGDPGCFDSKAIPFRSCDGNPVKCRPDAVDTRRGFSCPEGVRDFELLETCRVPASRVIMRTTTEYRFAVPEIPKSIRRSLAKLRVGIRCDGPSKSPFAEMPAQLMNQQRW